MANRSRVWISSLPNDSSYHRDKGRATSLRQTIALILFCFLSSGCASPWDFNNTCKEDHREYGTRCYDEFQKILDENSIIVNNTVGRY